MVTGFAHQATPLHALRMGVRDYLDKNQDLNRETFLAAVRRQLKTILPVKRRRQLANTLFAFREAVEKVLPLVQSSAAMSDRVPLPDAIRSLFRYLLRTTEAAGGVLVARHISGDGTEYFRAYGSDGEALEPPAVPFARSLAASVVSMQDVCAMNLHDSGTAGSFELQPFEERYQHVLAAPVRVAAATLVVLELFDKGGGKPFSEADRQLLAAASDFGAELLRQAMSERRTQRALFNAVEAALQASASLTSLSTAEEPPPASVMDKLREGLAEANGSPIGADASLRLAEAVRVLAVRHGPAAVQHCIAMVESLRKTLDEITGG
jgi:GAF domain-containing protein